MATVDEIAKKAGVSKTAVSFALNNKPGISEDTRNNILKIAREEGYFEKNKNQKMSNQNILLVMCSKSENSSIGSSNAPFHSELIREIEKSANNLGYNLLLKSLFIEDGKEIEPTFAAVVKNTAGTLAIGTDLLEQDVKMLMGLCDRIVILDSYFETINVNCVVMDNYMGGYKAAARFVELGHVNIGYIESKQRINNFDSRRRGFTDALKDKGITMNKKHTYLVSPSIEETKLELLTTLSTDYLPTAFFAENDYMAIGLLQCLTQRGVKVPDDVSIIGFDDIEIASFTTPELTTIRVFKDEIAQIAVKNIINMIENKIKTTVKEIVGVELAVRSSCARIKN